MPCGIELDHRMTASPFRKCNPKHPHGVPKIFLSYGHKDRRRADAVKMLLELGGAQVFMDWRSVAPGIDWEAALEKTLVDCDVLCVFWSEVAATSSWVRAEYTTFIGRFPDRPCVPLCADETPLPLILAKRQAPPEFLTLASEFLALRRDLRARGVGQREIRRIVGERIARLGLQLDDAQRRKLLGLFMSGASLGMLLSWLLRPVKFTAVLATIASIVVLVTVVFLARLSSDIDTSAERLDRAAQHAASIEHETIRNGRLDKAEAPGSADDSAARQTAPAESPSNQPAMPTPASQGSGARIATRPARPRTQLHDDTAILEDASSRAFRALSNSPIVKARHLLEARESILGVARFLHAEASLFKAEYVQHWVSSDSSADTKTYGIRYTYYWGYHPPNGKNETVLDFFVDQHGVVQNCSVAADHSFLGDPTFSNASEVLSVLKDRLKQDPEARRNPELARAAEHGDAAAVMVWLLRARKMSWVLRRPRIP